jgi:outer membrane immunogenic protein
MLKRFLPSSLVFILALGALCANAADLPRAKQSSPASLPLIFTWTGFHIGYNHGYGGAAFSNTIALAGGAIRSFDQANGWLAGAQIGYDHQFVNGLVLGLETDLQWSDIKSSHQEATTASNPFAATYANTSQSLGWYGTTRARLGYSFGRLLPYVTGGIGYGETSANSLQLLPGGGLVAGNARSTNVGWATGAGLDIALTEQLSARAEYLYLRLPGVSGPAVGSTLLPQQSLLGSFSTGATDAYAIRTGMNYRFGGLNELKPRMEGGLLEFLFKKAEINWSGFHIGVNGG